MREIKRPGYWRDFVGRDGHILGVEAALRVGPAIGVDFFANFQPPYACTNGRKDSGAVRAEDERKVRFAICNSAGPYLGVPRSDSRGVDGDQHLVGVDRWHGERANHNNVRSAEV